MYERVKRLLETPEFLQVVMQNITSAVLVMDRDARIYHINDVAGLLFGQKTQDMVGRLFGNAICCLVTQRSGMECGKFPSCAACSIRTAIEDVINKRRPIVKKKYTQDISIDGKKEQKIIQYSAKYIRYADEIFVIVIMDDITEAARQQEELERLNAELNKYVGIAAHDLRHPVSVIQMYSNLLRETVASRLNSDEKRFLNVILQKTEFMTAMLEGILDTAKIEAGVLELKLVRGNYVGFLRRVIEQNQILAKTKGIQILLECGVERAMLRFDKIRMEQVLNNLLHNAYKFSPPASEITVVLHKKRQNLETHVVDRGGGISDERLHHIFNPFQSGSISVLGQERSVGLGLAIVKKIVEAHGGTMLVNSKLKQGSDFFFRLPYRAAGS